MKVPMNLDSMLKNNIMYYNNSEWQINSVFAISLNFSEITENPFKEDFQCLTITNPLALSSQGKRSEDERVSTEDSNMKKMSASRASESSTPCAVVTANCTNEIGDDVA